MRFNWRRHLVLTAFATASLLSFAGCSSQQEQQGMGEEVAAEGQEDQGQEGDQTAEAKGQEGTEEGGGNAPVAEENQGGTGENAGGEGTNVVTNPANSGGEAAPNGDVAGIISEMSNVPAEGQATAEAAPAEAVPAPAATAEPAQGTGAVAEAPAPAPAEASSAAPGMPEMGSKMAYVVQPGDTLGKIAQKIFGDQKRWRDIAGLSGLDNPNHIYPGDLIYYALDDASKNFAQTYESSRRGKETVREGDTLAAISKRVYGKPNLWKHIWRQNDNIDNPDVLQAGMTVYFMEAGSLQSAFNSLKSMEVNKVVSKKINKTINLMTQAFFTPVPAV